MVFRIGLGIIALLCVVIIADIVRIQLMQPAPLSLYAESDEEAYGPATADVNVAAFLDYGCPWCKKLHPVLKEAALQDGNVRYRPVPVNVLETDDSKTGAFMTYMAGRQGKFMAMHEALIAHKGPLNDGTVAQLAFDTGVDMTLMNTEAQNPDIIRKMERRISENITLFVVYEGRATPYIVINDTIRFVPEGQMPTVDDFLQMFQNARQDNSQTTG